MNNSAFVHISDDTEQRSLKGTRDNQQAPVSHRAKLQPIILRIKWQLAKDLGEEFKKC